LVWVQKYFILFIVFSDSCFRLLFSYTYFLLSRQKKVSKEKAPLKGSLRALRASYTLVMWGIALRRRWMRGRDEALEW